MRFGRSLTLPIIRITKNPRSLADLRSQALHGPRKCCVIQKVEVVIADSGKQPFGSRRTLA